VLAGLVLAIVVNCAGATELDVDVYSEVECGKHAEVGFVVANGLAGLSNKASSSTSVHCEPSSQRVGRIVVTPSGSNDDEIALQIVTRNDDQGSDTCTAANGYKGCIVARRQLHFRAHESTNVRVDLRLPCLDKPCDPTSTCVKGQCVSAVCPNDDCDESKLTPSSADRPACVPGSPATTLAAGTVATDVTSNIATGLAQQNHLVLAENDCRYWYFYLDNGVNEVRTRFSTDLVTWTAGNSLTLPTPEPHGGIAANFSVAYANAGGTDVIHIVMAQPSDDAGGTGFVYDHRFTLDGPRGAAQPGAVVSSPLFPLTRGVQGGDCVPVDGPSIVIGADKHVYAATGWSFESEGPRAGTHCDLDVYRSDSAETGRAADWSGTFTQTGYYVTAEYTNNHLLVSLPSTNTVTGFFPEPQAGQSPDVSFDSVAWVPSVVDYDGGEAPRPYDGPSTFASGQGDHGTNDWAVCRLNDGDLRIVRRRLDGVFEAKRLSGSSWIDEAPPAALAQPDAAGVYNVVGSGLVILSTPDQAKGMAAFVMDPDDSTIRFARWLPASGWSSTWTSLGGGLDGRGRKWLAGSGCGSPRPTLFWTEPTASPTIGAMDVSSLFQ